jgi:hypothetical protein
MAILRHVGLYRLSFVHPIQRLFFSEEEFGDSLQALQRAGNALHGLQCLGLLASKHGKHQLEFSKQKYYILTPQGAKLIGIAPKSPNPNNDLAILWACTMDKKRFHRLETKEVAELFPDNPPAKNVPHIISQQDYDEDKTTNIVYRVYVTGHSASQIVKYVKQHYAKSIANDCLRPLVEVGDYGFAVLVPTEQRRKEVQKFLAKVDSNQSSLNRQARFSVRLGPTADTLREAIKELSP